MDSQISGRFHSSVYTYRERPEPQLLPEIQEWLGSATHLKLIPCEVCLSREYGVI